MLQVTIFITINSHNWLQPDQLTFFHLVVMIRLTPLHKFSQLLANSHQVFPPMSMLMYHMAAFTGLEAMKRLCNGVFSVYSATILQHLDLEDINQLLDEGQQNRFPGCIGLIDWLHALGVETFTEGHVSGQGCCSNCCFEAIADHNCWFWHFNFRSLGYVNNLNILDCSPLFDNAVLQGVDPEVEFVVNRQTYKS